MDTDEMATGRCWNTTSVENRIGMDTALDRDINDPKADLGGMEICQDNTNLHRAVCRRDTDAVYREVQSGMPVECVDNIGLTPLLHAVLTNQPECVRLLIAAGSDVNFISSNHGTGLHIACGNGYLDIVDALLYAGADPAVRGPDKQTCLHLATSGGHLEIVMTLLFYNAPVNTCDKKGFTPLHLAVMRNYEEIALYLIDNGALVTKQDSKGNSPLHFAVKQSNTELIKTLIAQGCDKDLMNFSHESPIYTAVKTGHTETLLVLVKLGCRTDVKQPNGGCTIHTLVSNYNSQYPSEFRIILEMLLYGGCDINTQAGGTLETPLYKAVGLAKVECVEVLLAYGADPNISGPFEITALRLAHTRRLSLPCVIMLHCGINWKREKWLTNLPLIHTSDPNTILGKCDQWRKQPTSLQNLCRTAFRRHCGKDLHQILVKRCDLPCSLKNFILLNDLKQHKHNSFLKNFGGGSWINSLLDEEMSYGPFKARKIDIPDIF